jgi:hypothetical protein
VITDAPWMLVLLRCLAGIERDRMAALDGTIGDWSRAFPASMATQQHHKRADSIELDFLVTTAQHKVPR